MKIVIDANVYASALMKLDGTPSLLLRHLINNDKICSLIGSKETLDELTKILWYPKVRSRILLTDKELKDWLSGLELLLELVNIEHLIGLPTIINEDPDDDKYIYTAIASDAEYIISGDQHLLKLNPYNKINIIKPLDFFNLIHKKQVE